MPNPEAETPAITYLDHFRGAREATLPTDRLREVRRRAQAFREEMLDDDPVVFYRSAALIRVPYPTRYGFLNACSRPTPYVHIVNRVFVVQYRAGDAIKTLLMSPSDIHSNQQTPFFADVTRSMGPFRRIGEKVMAPIHSCVEDVVADCGIRPEQVDYISFDHLHTQDVRKWIGTNGSRGYFPNAKLLVMRREWETTSGLLPWSAYWYHPHGIDGVDPERVIQLDGDCRLGEGVFLIHTPGHTEGNHSFVVRTPEGLMVTSENGIGPDAYAPEKSRVPGLRGFVRRTGAEVVLNGNTIDGGGVEQYISMVQEKEMAGPSQRHPDFPNVVTSSEFQGYWAFPGLRPTFRFGDLRFGAPHVTPAAAPASSPAPVAATS